MRASIWLVLASLSRPIAGIWTAIVLGILIGITANAGFSLLIAGKIEFTGTAIVLAWLLAHLASIITLTLLFLALTFCSWLAYHRTQQIAHQTTREQHHIHEQSLINLTEGVKDIGEGLKDIAIGVKFTLDEKIKPPSVLAQTDSPSNNQDTTSRVLIWNVPFPRNPLFTGREAILEQIHDTLSTKRTTTLTQAQTVSGLGGIGKTQTAVEYAYRYRQYYQAIVWVRAEAEDILLSDIAALSQASLLNLPQKDESEQSLLVIAVIGWFNTHSDWLLILDNVNDLRMIQTTLFQRTPIALQYGNGAILVTTRSQAVGTYFKKIDIPPLDAVQGADFLLRRANKAQTNEADRNAAKAISVALDGLPLALDQAGAYIEERTCSFSHYLTLYQKKRSILLQRRGNVASDHRESVTTTFTLSFEAVQQRNPIAADILRTCAFLSPENIPEEIIIEGATELSPTLQAIADTPHLFDDAFDILNTYSLVSRHPENQMLSLHRLVQAVLHDMMNEDEQRQWATWVTNAVNNTFPKIDYTHWKQCQEYLPHALECISLIKQWHLESKEAAQLLHRTALYLHDRVQYTKAEPLYTKALAIKRKALGPEHFNTAATMHTLASLYQAQGRYTDAEPVYKQALAIYQKALGPEHPNTATTMNELASLYQAQGRYTDAELLYTKALAIYQKILDSEHPNTAATMHELARLYQAQGRYADAELLYTKALAIKQKTEGPEHPNTAITMHNLARLYQAQGRYADAEPLYLQALTIYQKALGPEHPNTIIVLASYNQIGKKK